VGGYEGPAAVSRLRIIALDQRDEQRRAQQPQQGDERIGDQPDDGAPTG
jgi:hypothetical protein